MREENCERENENEGKLLSRKFQFVAELSEGGNVKFEVFDIFAQNFKFKKKTD